MKRIFISTFIILSLSSIFLAQENDIFKQTYPATVVLKPTLKVRCIKDVNYWKEPNLKNYWSWMPKVEVAVAGPVSDTSYVTFEFFTPDGKPWYSYDTSTFSVAEGKYHYIESEAVPRWTDKRSTILTGVFSFKMTLKNALQGTNKLLYQGKFNVKKSFAGTSHPDFKNQYLFYVEQDWILPVAYLNGNARQNADSPFFLASMWFRGNLDGKLKAYLFYNGKQIDNSDVSGGSLQTNTIFSEGDSENKFRWEQWTFNFYKTRFFDNQNGNNFHLFKRSPGNYEIKVLLDDEIVRTIAFTVGVDGNITDSGIAKSNEMTGFGVIVPAKINSVKEGTINLLSYKTDAFYGNPLVGFSIQ